LVKSKYNRLAFETLVGLDFIEMSDFMVDFDFVVDLMVDCLVDFMVDALTDLVESKGFSNINKDLFT
jgi:hypothetical protein